jgi:TRAP transporter TAXI family solute receptor
MKRIALTAAAVALAAGAFVAAEAPVAEAQQKFITIGTGGVTGVYYPTGGAICRLVNKGRKQHGIRCSVESTGGSVYNLNTIRAGELDMGVAQSDWQYHAYHGTSKFKDAGPFKELRAVFSVHPEPFTVVARADSGIMDFMDLEGKRVNIGNPGSGQRGTMEVVMAALGWDKGTFALASELKSAEQSKALCDGKIDGYGYTVGVPNAGVAVATDGCGARIINLAGDVEKKLVSANPFYAFATIPKGTYKSTTADVTTFGVMATFVTSADVSDQVVYEVTRAALENIADFRKLHPAFRNLDPKRMMKDGLSAPLHKGAAKYYKEKGMM